MKLVCYSFWIILFVQFAIIVYPLPSIRISSNFNSSKLSQKAKSQLNQNDHLTLPIILTNPGQYKSNKPFFQNYKVQRYQLYDSNYRADTGKISKLQQQLVFNMEPPTGVFEENGKIIIQNYRLLEIRELKLTLINPSEKFRFCIDQIYIDSEEITRQQKRPLPFCMNGTTKYPFFFSLYITQHKPMIFKATVYFIITIYDQNQVVDWKIWPKQIIVKILHNHLRLIPLQIRNCQKQNSIVMIRNPQKWDLSLVIIYKRKLYELTGEPIQGNIVIPALKSYKFIIDGKDSKMTIYTKSSNPQIIYPVLYVPIYCLQDLIIDYFNIGILSEERSVIQFPITLSSYSNTTIRILQINLKSSTQTIQLLTLRQNFNVQIIPPNSRHVIVCRIIIYTSKSISLKSHFQVIVKYMSEQQKSYQSNSQQIEMQIRQTRMDFSYIQMRSPITIGDNKRFIDISKLNQSQNRNEVAENGFPIRNNLNIPVNLMRVIYDQSKFKLLWLQDRRDYIFPNHQREQFSFQYIGSKDLHLSPTKYLALLQFNGNIFIPIQVIVYDKTLQCIYNQQTTKCDQLQTIDFGYFNEVTNQERSTQQFYELLDQEQSISLNSSVKSKLITIRNYNPEVIDIKLGVQQDCIQKYGFNMTIQLFGPFPNYEVLIKKDKNMYQIKLKANHFIVVGISLSPLHNASSGSIPFRILTHQQHITKPIKFKVQNGTIALIPQITRFHSTFSKTIQYINLVSTYTQPYRIKSIHTNMSNVMVYCNNYSEIYENQWIGMAVIYEPFNGQFNITNQCCGSHFMNKIMPQIMKPNYLQSVQITLKTTTQLTTNATVVIDKSSIPLIQSPFNLFYNNRQKFRKDAVRIDINLIQEKNNEYEYAIQIKNQFDLNLKGNIFMFEQTLIQRLQEYIDYQKKMHDKALTYFCVKNQVKVKHGFSPSLLKVLFRLDSLPIQITVQPIDNSTIYVNSPANPRQQFLKVSQVSQYFFKTIQSGSRMCYRMEAQLYIKNLIQTGIVNYMSQHFRYQTLATFMNKQFQQLQIIPNQSEDSSYSTYNDFKYHLQYDDFYMHNYIDQNYYCKSQKNEKKMTALFRYCQHINIKTSFSAITQQKTVIRMEQCREDKERCRRQGKKIKKIYGKQKNKYFLLSPQNKLVINYKVIPYDPKLIPVGVQLSSLSNSKAGRISQFSNWSSGIQLNPLPTSRFYLSLINNYTTFQLYHKTIQVTKPKLRIKNVLIDGQQIQITQFQLHYFKQLQSSKDRNQILPIHIGEQDTQQLYVKIGSKHQENEQKQTLEQNHQFQQILPVNSIQLESQIYVQGQRIFQIVNQGQADVSYTHIGIQNIQHTCQYGGFSIVADGCPNKKNKNISKSILQSYKIHPKQKYVIKVRYNMSLQKMAKLSEQTICLYLYNSDNYHIKLLFYIKLSPKLLKMNQTSVEFQTEKIFIQLWNIALSLFAFVFICMVIFMFKEQNINQNAKKIFLVNSKVNSRLDKSQNSLYKSNKKLRTKQQTLYEWAANKSQDEGRFKILQPSSYPYTIGTLITQKQTSFHPVVTVTEQILASIKQEQKKQSNLIAYFNQSEQSQIIAKHQHQIENNISLNLNLDDLADNENQKKNDSVSEDSSFDFGIHRNQQEKNQEQQDQDSKDSNQNSDFSIAQESDLPDGVQVQITEQILNDSDQGFGFGFQSGTKVPKKETEQKKQEPIKEQNKSYYNVFFAQNPLKKSSNNSPFSWMNNNEDKKRSRLKW